MLYYLYKTVYRITAAVILLYEVLFAS